MKLTARYDPTPAGLAALEPQPMMPVRVRDLVRRARENEARAREQGDAARSATFAAKRAARNR